MEQTKNKPTSSKKRVVEPQVEGGSKKERKRLKKLKTEPEAETRSQETRIKKIMEFKSQGQKITEKEKLKKVLLKKLQKLRKSGKKPASKPETTTVKIEQKETKTEPPAVSTIRSETREIGESSLKLQEVGTKAGESKKKTSPTDGCVNKEDAYGTKIMSVLPLIN